MNEYPPPPNILIHWKRYIVGQKKMSDTNAYLTKHTFVMERYSNTAYKNRGIQNLRLSSTKL